MSKKFAETIGKISVFVGKSSGILYVTAIALSVYEVFTRYVLNAPTVWTTEAVMALCGTAWLLSAGAVTQQHRHITVTVMELVVGETIWNRMRKVAIVLSLVAVLGLMFASWEPFLRSLAHMERSGSAFNPPLPTYLKVMIILALTLYGLQLIANLIKKDDTIHDHGTSHMDLTVDIEEIDRGH